MLNLLFDAVRAARAAEAGEDEEGYAP